MEKPFLERLFVVVKKRVELLNSIVRGVVMSSPQGQSSMNGWYLMEQQDRQKKGGMMLRLDLRHITFSQANVLRSLIIKLLNFPTQQRLCLYFRPGFHVLNTKM